jgi:hypothetical protein
MLEAIPPQSCELSAASCKYEHGKQKDRPKAVSVFLRSW